MKLSGCMMILAASASFLSAEQIKVECGAICTQKENTYAFAVLEYIGTESTVLAGLEGVEKARYVRKFFHRATETLLIWSTDKNDVIQEIYFEKTGSDDYRNVEKLKWVKNISVIFDRNKLTIIDKKTGKKIYP